MNAKEVEIFPGYKIPIIKKEQLKDIDTEVDKLKEIIKEKSNDDSKSQNL